MLRCSKTVIAGRFTNPICNAIRRTTPIGIPDFLRADLQSRGSFAEGSPHPAATDYLYFVADPRVSGHSLFAETLEEHQRM